MAFAADESAAPEPAATAAAEAPAPASAETTSPATQEQGSDDSGRETESPQPAARKAAKPAETEPAAPAAEESATPEPSAEESSATAEPSEDAKPDSEAKKAAKSGDDPTPEVTTETPSPEPDAESPQLMQAAISPMAAELEVAALVAGPEPGISSPYVYWEVRGTDSALVGGANFELRGPRGSGSNGWTSAATYNVSDCVAAPCSGADQDPSPGEFQVANNTGGITGMTNTSRWRVLPTSLVGYALTPVAGYEIAGTNATSTTAAAGEWVNAAGTYSHDFGDFTATAAALTGTMAVTVRKRVTANPTSVGGSVTGNVGSDASATGTAGAKFRLYTYTTAAAGPQQPTDFTCTITAASPGACTITITGAGLPPAQGGTQGNRYWVVEEESPSGTFSNPSLMVGSYTGPTDKRELVGLTQAVQANLTNYLPMVGSGVTGGTVLTSSELPSGLDVAEGASFGAVVNSVNNPSVPPKCTAEDPLRVALVLDQSSSISESQWDTFRGALVTGSNSVLGILASAGARVSILGFGTSTASPNGWHFGSGGPAVLPANYATLIPSDRPGGSGNATNWDAALSTIASVNASHDYDLVMLITDGAPNYILSGDQVSSYNVTLRSLEAPIYAANSIKNAGTRLVAIGVGSGITSAGANLRSVSGTSLNSDYYQTPSWDDLKIQLTNIAQSATCRVPVTITKHVNNGTTSVLTNGWSMSASPSNVSSGSATLSPSATTQVTGSGTNATGATNWSIGFTSPHATADLTVGETLQGNYAFSSGTCTITHSGGGQTSVTLTSVSQKLIGITTGDRVECDFVNATQSHLTLVKRVDNGNTGATNTAAAWTLTAAGPATVSGAGNSATIVNQLVPAGDYDLSESGPGGYDASAWDCGSATVAGSTVTVPPAADVTCTIINTAKQPKLTLVKKVVNDHGGTAAASAWTLAASGPTSGITGSTGSASVTNVPVKVGSYTLSETAGPAGYTNEGWTCSAGSLTGSTVAVGLGDNLTCTVTNNDNPAHLTLVKVVDNGTTGATATKADWTLTATSGATTVTGKGDSAAIVNVEVPAGVFNLSESGGPSGYAASAWQCTGATTSTASSVTVPFTGNVTCTVTNTAKQPKLTLVKKVTNNNGGTAAATDWTLTATGPTDGISGATGSAPVTGRAVKIGSYTLAEANGPAGYTASDWICTAGQQGAASVALALGDDITCTITNDDSAAKLTLVKTVTNDNGGTAAETDWTLTATGPTSISGTTGSTAVTGVTVDAGSYTLAETGGPSGYLAGAWTCTGATATGSQVVVPSGGDVTCTINNNDRPAQLTLVKTVTNDNGGTAVATDWTLKATGPTTISGATGATSVTNAAVAAGTYELSETGGASGYTAGAWSCTAGTLTGSSLVLGNGVSATCTINNDDQAARLTLVKTVTNNNGGTAVATDWTLAAGGPTPISGASGADSVTNAAVSAGTYSLSESNGPDGYTAGAWSCTAGTLTGSSLVLGNGVSATCTINNDDRAAQLTLVKTVTNDNGGTAEETDWTLQADGPTAISGVTATDAVTNASVSAGTYDLSESGGPSGYTAGSWSCTAGSLVGSSLTLGNGESATCTINNDDQPGTLTLTKKVVNSHGGTAAATDWNLSATKGQTVIQGAGGFAKTTVDAGEYSLAEAIIGSVPVGGYTASAWTCTGATASASGAVTVPNGTDVSCEITNTDRPATLTLIKDVDGEAAGSGKVPSDWTLTATRNPAVAGQPVVSGNGDPNATGGVKEVPVFAGDYALTESGPDGFDPQSWSCEGGVIAAGATPGKASVAVPNGGNVICRITNKAVSPELTLVKIVRNAAGGTAVATDWTLSADGPTPISGKTAETAITRAPVKVGSYTLAETGPDGYAATAWVCTGTGTQDGDEITLAEGQAATCTITNTDLPATLTLVKEVTNNSGGTAAATDWTLSAQGPTPISGATGTDAVKNAVVNAGLYLLSETGPSGYVGGDWKCEGGVQSGSSINLLNGQSATCTIVNDDQPALLTLQKIVTNDNGGTAARTDWTLFATGPTSITGVHEATSVTNAVVSAGVYELGEKDGPSGYTAGSWSCVGGSLNGSELTLGNGESATCTINNDDDQGILSLVKHVANTHGGTAEPADWNLSATLGATVVQGPGGFGATAVDAGGYTLAETGPAGYAAGSWQCTNGALTGATVTVANGVDVVCEITNSDLPGSIELVKKVANNNGGQAVATEWTLSATLGQTVVSGAGGVPATTVDAGRYTLAESTGPSGYTAGDWICTGGAEGGDATSVVVPNGGTVKCEITNSDQPAQLTLVKNVLHGQTGATQVPADWTLTATPIEIEGQQPVSGNGDPTTEGGVNAEPVFAGAYRLTESELAGYTAGDWTCGDSEVVDGIVIVPNGAAITCQITNTADQSYLTLVKEVVNSHGGTNPATDWTLTATSGATTVTGVTGPALTMVAVPIGSYDLSEAANEAVPVGGYLADEWQCVGGRESESAAQAVVGLGDNVTCTVVNRDQPAQLTLVKVVDGVQAGSGRIPDDWTLTATTSVEGQDPVSGNGNPESSGGVKQVSVFAGDYTLSEAGPSGFDAGAWICEGGVVTTTETGEATVTIKNGGNVICQITNTARSPKLTLVKVVAVGDTGSLATAADWSLSATGPTPISGVTGDAAVTSAPVQVGTYTLAESSGPAGFTASAWSCVGATVTGASITLAEGDDATCTITNTAQAAVWTVTKSSDPTGATKLEPGTVITYYVNATKLDGVDPTNIVVLDDATQVFQYATFVDGSLLPGAGTATISGDTITWNLPQLTGTATLAYQVRINDGAYAKTLVNNATGIGAVACVSTEPSLLAMLGAAVADCDTTVHNTTDPVVEDTDDNDGNDVDGLAYTGTDALGAGVIGLGLLGLGVLAVLAGRRRRES